MDVLKAGRLDPLLWLPVEDLLIDGENDILQPLRGEEELPNSPEVRPLWDGDLWFGSGPFSIWFQRAKGGRRTPVFSQNLN